MKRSNIKVWDSLESREESVIADIPKAAQNIVITNNIFDSLHSPSSTIIYI